MFWCYQSKITQDFHFAGNFNFSCSFFGKIWKKNIRKFQYPWLLREIPGFNQLYWTPLNCWLALGQCQGRHLRNLTELHLRNLMELPCYFMFPSPTFFLWVDPSLQITPILSSDEKNAREAAPLLLPCPSPSRAVARAAPDWSLGNALLFTLMLFLSS